MLFAFVALIVTTANMNAQNANRNGWIVEVQGGQVIGTAYQSEDFEKGKENGKLVGRRTGGFFGSFNFGYRWATSKHCAVELKLIVADNFSDAKLLQTGLLPGFRYTTKELIGNTSMYLGANVGASIEPILTEQNCDLAICANTEANVGFNIGNLLSIGIFINYNIPCRINDSTQIRIDGCDMYLTSNASLGVKLGIRF